MTEYKTRSIYSLLLVGESDVRGRKKSNVRGPTGKFIAAMVKLTLLVKWIDPAMTATNSSDGPQGEEGRERGREVKYGVKSSNKHLDLALIVERTAYETNAIGMLFLSRRTLT